VQTELDAASPNYRMQDVPATSASSPMHADTPASALAAQHQQQDTPSTTAAAAVGKTAVPSTAMPAAVAGFSSGGNQVKQESGLVHIKLEGVGDMKVEVAVKFDDAGVKYEPAAVKQEVPTVAERRVRDRWAAYVVEHDWIPQFHESPCIVGLHAERDSVSIWV
jgi:hypothetical protein